ncbi:ABC transporter ATP-binding protein [Bacillus horti]|uniref:ABC-2 type transport system ATP-binding protein n=1 Tax=Caldalkalibacillus horti TaxID=77523 RepID=A0ABT9W0G0_9BACI|nr:ATP-binding cassette domain-containing protein [Bacillus horti]MDQ0166761.1 ABC-2 type transport system ATP-binding protein [Bacillus horti]
MQQPLLEVVNISKSYKNSPVVNSISFDVHKGEILGILGPNGAGKSTTIRGIMNIIPPDDGEIRFHLDGGKHEGLPKAQLGYLPEERGLYKGVRIMDILLYFAKLKDYPLSKAKERAFAYLEKFDLKGKENSKIEELSKGMAQKVQFIASLIHEPKLLILDEPFSGLDPVSQDIFKQEINELAKNGTSILLSAHQMNLVEELCDRIFMIHQGREVVYGRVHDVKQQFADFKCEIIGENEHMDLSSLQGVKRVTKESGKQVLFLEKEVSPQVFLRTLPESLDIKELHIDRISLHDIFVGIARGGITNEK